MENSILTSTKKILGLAVDYTVFDLDVITHINSALSTLSQFGIGPSEGILIEDETTEWSVFNIPNNHIGLVKTYVYLKVRMLFDPPTTSYMIDAMNKQIEEHAWRLNTLREELLHPLIPEEEVV